MPPNFTLAMTRATKYSVTTHPKTLPMSSDKNLWLAALKIPYHSVCKSFDVRIGSQMPVLHFQKCIQNPVKHLR